MKRYDVATVRGDFPFLTLTPGAIPIYLDNAATTQKPRHMIEKITQLYSSCMTNVHRGIYEPAESMTAAYEGARAYVAQFLGAQPHEIVFTSGATEGINFVAAAWGMQHLKPGDEILITALEHHSNFVVWQRLAERTGTTLRILPIDEQGMLRTDLLAAYLTPATKLFAFTAVSNALGTVNDVAALAHRAHAVGARVFVDAAQAVGHMLVDVRQWHADFLVLSGHKVYGPTGIGVLYINQELQADLEPYRVGGGMVFEADDHTARWLNPPHRFEAGSPPVVQAIGLQVALAYVTSLGLEAIQAHEAALCAHLIAGLQALAYVRILGPVQQLKREGHLVSFIVENVHAHDVAAHLSTRNIFVRAGHHCAQPLARRLGVGSTVRVSFACYSTADEVDALLKALVELL